MRALLLALLLPSTALAGGAPASFRAALDRELADAHDHLIAWRRHLHAHPELSNQEVETAAYVAARLRDLGLEPRTGVARHGVVAVIEGGLPGPVVALRADMDGLPVEETTGLDFASKATGTFEGRTVPVMHACGHDAHMAMLLAAAEALVGVKAKLPGKVVLIFQPAEEGVPRVEQPAGAEKMVAEGVLDAPKVEAVFGLHVFSAQELGTIQVAAGPVTAAADRFEIVVEGKQAHGSKPWVGIDPIVVGSEIVGALQTIVSRSVDLTKEPAVVTVGQFEAGVRNNIIPQKARLVGTIRTFDAGQRADVAARVERIAQHVAEAHGAHADVTVERGYPVTVNDADLLAELRPTLERVAPGKVSTATKITGAEDFAFYAERVPGLFLFLGATPAERLPAAAGNHAPGFVVDEATLPIGARALAHLAADWLYGHR